MFKEKLIRKKMLLTIVLLCLGTAVGMQKRQDAFPDMPTSNIVTNEEIKRDFFNMIYKKPLDRPELGFELLIPKTWEGVRVTVRREEVEHDDLNMITLALLQAPDERVQVEVGYCRVPKDTDLEEWARAYLEINHLELLHFQVGIFTGRRVFDTLVKADVEGGGEYRVRMTFSLHGDKLFLVSGSAPASLYEQYMKVLGLAAVTFRKF